MELLERLQKEFPSNHIKLEHNLTSPISYEHWEIIMDGKKLKVQFRDWSELFQEKYNLDIKDEVFNQVITEIKKEIKNER